MYLSTSQELDLTARPHRFEDGRTIVIVNSDRGAHISVHLDPDEARAFGAQLLAAADAADVMAATIAEVVPTP